MARYLRDLASPWRAVGRSRERIFLTRGNLRRNLLNLAEIEGILREHGFSVIDPADHPATIEHCANAEIIAGVDGSNLANIAFAPEGACIMIFICATAAPPEPYNLTLATSGGRQLHILQGIFPRAESTRYNEGFVLPPERLRACLRAVCPAVP
jgi:capsular polysaccharide biosynthesis protein